MKDTQKTTWGFMAVLLFALGWISSQLYRIEKHLEELSRLPSISQNVGELKQDVRAIKERP